MTTSPDIAAGMHPEGTLCLACGYDLSHVAFGPCPECGVPRDAGYARRLQKHERWIRILANRNVIAPEILQFIGGLVSIVAVLAAPPAILLAPCLIAPCVTLVIGYGVIRFSLSSHVKLHHAVWSQLHARLWTPVWSWAPALIATIVAAFTCAIIFRSPFLMFTIPMLVFMCVNVGVASFAAYSSLKRWHSRVQRVAHKLDMTETLWSPRLSWLPIAIVCLSTLMGVFPAISVAFIFVWR